MTEWYRSVRFGENIWRVGCTGGHAGSGDSEVDLGNAVYILVDSSFSSSLKEPLQFEQGEREGWVWGES